MGVRSFFRNRTEAGRLLAQELKQYANRPEALVLALPRGGVPVAYEVARALNAPLDVFVVRKLGLPGHSELAMGAIASGGVRVLNNEVVEGMAIPDTVIDAVAAEEQLELERREIAFRGHNQPPDIEGKIVILIDDGIATGSTMRAAIRAIKQQRPSRLIVAVPTGAASSCAEIATDVDDLVAVMMPEDFFAVGQWYQDFSQTSDEEVANLLEKSRQLAGSSYEHRQ